MFFLLCVGFQREHQGVQTRFESHGIGEFGSGKGREGAFLRLGEHPEGLVLPRAGAEKGRFPTPTGPRAVVGPPGIPVVRIWSRPWGAVQVYRLPWCLNLSQSQGREPQFYAVFCLRRVYWEFAWLPVLVVWHSRAAFLPALPSFISWWSGEWAPFCRGGQPGQEDCRRGSQELRWGVLATLLNPLSCPAVFYKSSPSAGGSLLRGRGVISCMPLLPAMRQAFY